MAKCLIFCARLCSGKAIWSVRLVSKEGDQIPALKFQIHYKKDSSFNVLTLYLCVQYPTAFKSLQEDLEGNFLAGKVLVQLIVGFFFLESVTTWDISGYRAV